MGFAAGRFLPEPLDRFYFEFDYLYTFLEQFQGTSVSTSTGLVETDFFATERLMLRLYAVGVKTHNGLGPADFRGDPDLFEHHEQLGRIDQISVAAGASYLLSAHRQRVFVGFDDDLGRERARGEVRRSRGNQPRLLEIVHRESVFRKRGRQALADRIVASLQSFDCLLVTRFVVQVAKATCVAQKG